MRLLMLVALLLPACVVPIFPPKYDVVVRRCAEIEHTDTRTVERECTETYRNVR